jgi:acyl carrier protein
MTIKPEKLIKLVENALEMQPNTISIDSNSENTEAWDSLGHLSILIALDKAFNGKVGKIQDMAMAKSIQTIMSLLDDNSLELS